MSARKLGRIAGFVFVLAVVFGTPAVASAAEERKAEVSADTAVTGIPLRLIDIIWN
jgi:hypothetical protein